MTRARACTLLVALVVLVSGCASIPTGGPVHAGRMRQSDVQDTSVRLLASRPQKGASPESIVRGFLLAAADFEDDHARARDYLAPTVSQRWRADHGIRIFDSSTLRVHAAGSAVSVAFAQVAVIDDEGRWRWLASPATSTVMFRTAKVDGEWRISSLSDGMLLTPSDAGRAYRASKVYFLDPGRRVLVPDAVLVPNRLDLASALVNRLLKGPTSWLAPSVVTAFPPGTALVDGAVHVQDGTASVDLTEEALQANAGERQAMSAQLGWTLAQLPEISSVRVTVGGRDFPVPNGSSPEPVGRWASFDPSVLAAGAMPYAEHDGALGYFLDGRFTRVEGPAGNGRIPLSRPSISLGSDLVAGLTDGGRTLVRGPLGPQDRLVPVLTQGSFGASSWDLDGNLWTLDTTGPGRVRVLTSRAQPVDVPVKGLAGRRIVSLHVARDGTRVLLVLQAPRGRGTVAETYVAVVVPRPGSDVPSHVQGLTALAPTLTEVTDLAWVDDYTVAILGSSGDVPLQPTLVSADGFTTTATPTISKAVAIAAAPAQRPLLVETSDHVIYELSSGGGWTVLGNGRDPAYPG